MSRKDDSLCRTVPMPVEQFRDDTGGHDLSASSSRWPWRTRCEPLSTESLPSDVLAPKLRMLPDESPHHVDAARVLDHLHRHATTGQELLLAAIRDILADPDARNAVEENCAGAPPASRYRRVQDPPPITRS